MTNTNINDLLEQFYEVFYEMEKLSLKKGFKNLTTTESHTIEAIGDECIPMKVLADRLEITMGTATVAITKLTEKNFVKREKDPSDRRKVLVGLTPKGFEVYNYHKNYHKNLIANITNELPDEEIECFKRVLKKILKNSKIQFDRLKNN
ncbi:MAG: MarR family winged helix-turn-helix transcriptional regulator [Fusobacteriota bacterium]